MQSSLLKVKIQMLQLRYKKPNQISRFIFTRTPLLSKLADIYYHVKYHTRYYAYINSNAYRHYNNSEKSLTPYEKQAVSSIKIAGVFTDAIEKLCRQDNMLKELTKDADALLKPILDAGIQQNRLPPTRIMAIGRDIQNATIPPAFINFFLSDTVLNIVNACHGQLSRLNYIDAWYNNPATDNAIYYTEQWHRDHEDLKMLKVFVYLSNVDEDMGPFSYLQGTQFGGKMGHINPVNPPRGVAVNAKQLNKILSLDPACLKVFTGESGTVIISDMTGLHKGGRTTSVPRKVVLATFTSDAGVDPHRYRLPESINPNNLSLAAKYALRLT